jgi:hypothetical protein
MDHVMRAADDDGIARKRLAWREGGLTLQFTHAQAYNPRDTAVRAAGIAFSFVPLHTAPADRSVDQSPPLSHAALYGLRARNIGATVLCLCTHQPFELDGFSFVSIHVKWPQHVLSSRVSACMETVIVSSTARLRVAE